MMNRIPLPWRWFLGLAALLAALLLDVNLVLRWSLPGYLRGQILQDLTRNAWLAHEAFDELLAAPAANAARLNEMASQLSRRTGLRVTIMDTAGTVIADSNVAIADLPKVENHLMRQEVQQALRDGLGWATRHSATINADLLYVATVVKDTEVRGFVRVAMPLVAVRETIARVEGSVAVASLLIGLLALPLVFYLSRRVSKPVAEMSQMAGRVAHGDFTARAPQRISGELGDLGLALNDMARQLETRLRELGEEKAGLSAILSGMTEGVLVTDAAGRIRLMNGALREQLQLTDEAIGKTPLEALRNVELEQLIASPGARELAFLTPAERIFAVNAAILAGNAGAVVVFHDITRLKQLESIRKEFVANVSHELRTPLSIIKGYIETLLDEHPPDAVTARQFLQTIQRHGHRLELLIEDLLNISALESQQARLDFVPVSLRDLATAVIEELGQQIREKQMTVTLELPPALPNVRGDSERLRQVFVNLLDNAVKYTPPGGHLHVNAHESGQEIECSISDNGPGIAAEHLPRVFERFYRVDKARSRELGGTGLGLSIVKHIVQSHGGRVWAESRVGEGSRFCFTLPRA